MDIFSLNFGMKLLYEKASKNPNNNNQVCTNKLYKNLKIRAYVDNTQLVKCRGIDNVGQAVATARLKNIKHRKSQH